MQTIIMDRSMQTSVLGVSMDSLKRTHVRIGNIKYEVPNPINLTAQTEFSSAS